MNGLVLLVLLSIAPTRAVAPADTSIYIENVLWPHASREAKPVNEPRPAPRLEPFRKSRGARRP